ncbi:aminotransferase class III-fold pyridoxal phosphate-dependent enzyme [Nocardia asteroides]|uniref:aminotransferase class III-fold pyridoxal phosphate-dependent enzyme n=1 Tax=Nocardia asteroides TaxID=1824 RepID=UPI001E2921FE|nr:aminotransferase class III-fold pyridoxal phosphate-dependent enzyme [Nocardia asteroides]UGT59861.1 aminotransferase class III-fold pyridoxal phosphate-dependent enzyme [Nocardia asteroides]
MVTALVPSYPPIVEAHGGLFTVADGRHFIDLSAQTLNLALGHGFSSVSEAVAGQAKKMEFASSRFASVPFLELCDRLAGLAPAGVDAVAAKLTNGSDAVETAIKLALLHTRRRRIGCLPGAWHGESFMTLGLATSHRGRALSDGSLSVAAEEPTIAALTRLVAGRRDLAAVVLDPAMVAHGLPENGINADLRRLRTACDRAGTLLVTDEVQSFGWLGGALFTSEQTGVVPDIVCLGKALGAGYPLAAVLARRDLRAVLQYNDAEFTGGGHPVSCAAALAGLDYLDSRRAELAQRALDFADLLAGQFPSDRFEVRCQGLIASVALGSPRLAETWAAQVAAQAGQAGVFVRLTDRGRRLLIKPPLVLDVAHLRRGLSQVAAISTATADELGTVCTSEHVHSEGGRRCVVRRDIRAHPYVGYVDALLRTAAPGVQPIGRGPRQQYELSARLDSIGVPAAICYPVEGAEAVDQGWVPGRALHTVLGDPGTDPGLINGLVLRHYELVTRAHDHGIAIGDRWPGNAIVTERSDIVLIDFELGFDGPHHDACAFEEAFTILQTLVAVPEDNPVREDLLFRLLDAMSDRHGITRCARAWERLAQFYRDPARPIHDGSDTAQAYAGLLWAALSRLVPQTDSCS